MNMDRMLGGHSRGRCKVDRPPGSWEKRDEPCDREVMMIESRILVSTFFAITSAAFPLGARIIGT